MDEITVVVVEKANAVMTITSDELKMIEEVRAKKAREELVESYRNEIADLLNRMNADNIRLQCIGNKGVVTSCSKLSTGQPVDAIRII